MDINAAFSIIAQTPLEVVLSVLKAVVRVSHCPAILRQLKLHVSSMIAVNWMSISREASDS